jgi:hypothetical protein
VRHLASLTGRMVPLLVASALLVAASPPQECHRDYAALRAEEMAAFDQAEQVQRTTPKDQRTPEQVEIVKRAGALLTSRTRIADAADLAIVQRADAMLGSETTCLPEDPKLSLFCALQKASIEVGGSYQHRRTALQEVRFAVEDKTRGKAYQHRLRDFNNDQATTLADIRAVLAAARLQIERRLADQAACKL